MPLLQGTPSDDAEAVLATGRTDVSTIFYSMSARHPDGRDAEYLAWHTLDHRPEQYRLASLRAALRVVSTPECRAARAASDPRYDAVDHIITYFFADLDGLEPFGALGAALGDAGRMPYVFPAVERGVFRLDGAVAAPRAKVGADVLVWVPARGLYVLIERGEASPAALVDVPGVMGTWWGGTVPLDVPYATADNAGLQFTYCFLDDDPVATAERLQPVLDARWADGAVEPLLAAPFHVLVPYEWERYLP
jgi:hypothetical protein